jgi:zinc D-Ala-D-Ala carboxypeptidase
MPFPRTTLSLAEASQLFFLNRIESWGESMKYVLLLVPCLAFAVAAAPSLGSNQTKRKSYTSKVARSERRTEPVAASTVAPTVLSLNSSLAESAVWQFGSRPQTGWRLYIPLIQKTLGTSASPESEEFARAARQWRKTQGLAPADGLFDLDAWMRLMSGLQSARLRDSTRPPETELVQVPAEEWLYPERPPELRFLRRDAYDAYKRMLSAARADLGNRLPANHLRLVSGYRTPEYQEEIRQREGGNVSTAALAKNSPHFSGRAMDIYVGGSPVSTADSNRAIQVATPAYQWLVANAHRFGFRPYFYEPWHWEYDPRLAKGK